MNINKTGWLETQEAALVGVEKTYGRYFNDDIDIYIVGKLLLGLSWGFKSLWSVREFQNVQ
jgi:hypothetical protein